VFTLDSDSDFHSPLRCVFRAGEHFRHLIEFLDPLHAKLAAGQSDAIDLQAAIGLQHGVLRVAEYREVVGFRTGREARHDFDDGRRVWQQWRRVRALLLVHAGVPAERKS